MWYSRPQQNTSTKKELRQYRHKYCSIHVASWNILLLGIGPAVYVKCVKIWSLFVPRKGHIHDRGEDAILEFELFVVSLENKNNNLKVKDFLQFVAAVDRVPITGFTKPIEVYFVDEDIFPKVSTCGLTLTLPWNVTCDMLSFAVKDGRTFGVNWRFHVLVKIVHLKFLMLHYSSVRNCRGG